MMKTEKETTAKIASDVRKATRERAEAEHAEARALRRELEKEERAKLKIRKEKLAGFFYGLATFFFTSTGIGGLSPFILNTDNPINWVVVLCGISASFICVVIANNILKY